MRSGPANRRFAAWLALAALGLQIAVSFGHIHLDGVRTAQRTASVTGATADVKSLPSPQPADDEDEYCAICATIYLTASSFVPQPPHLPAALESRPVDHFDRAANVFVAALRTAFQSRAPPPG